MSRTYIPVNSYHHSRHPTGHLFKTEYNKLSFGPGGCTCNCCKPKIDLTHKRNKVNKFLRRKMKQKLMKELYENN